MCITPLSSQSCQSQLLLSGSEGILQVETHHLLTISQFIHKHNKNAPLCKTLKQQKKTKTKFISLPCVCQHCLESKKLQFNFFVGMHPISCCCCSHCSTGQLLPTSMAEPRVCMGSDVTGKYSIGQWMLPSNARECPYVTYIILYEPNDILFAFPCNLLWGQNWGKT